MWSITPCYILSEVSHAFGVSSPVSHLLLILISYVTLFHVLLPCSNFGNWDQPLSPNACDTSDNSTWLLRCDGKSAGTGGLINGSNTMIFLGMINDSNTMLLLAGTGGLINGRDMTFLLLAGPRFG
jgi:hypothetical protein